MNTVHIEDVSKAIAFAANEYLPVGIYNLSDLGNTTQGKINALISRIFQIQSKCVGKFKSTLAMVYLNSLVEKFNKIHVKDWLKQCLQHDIEFTPL